MSLTNTSSMLNGVDVNALFATIEAVQEEPAIGQFNFRAKNTWLGGSRNCTTIADFTGGLGEHRKNGACFTAFNGEPEILLGADDAPNPAEWLLHALIGCMTTSTAYHAASRGIAIKAIESELDGDLDLRGFLGLSADVRKGYTAIRVMMRVKTDADAETIRALTRMSPVLDVVSRAVPVAISVKTY